MSGQSQRISPLARSRLRRWRRFRTDERGAVSAELVLAVPAVLLLLLLIAQFAIWAHATHIAEATADRALAAVREQGGSSARGQTEADTMLTQLASGALRHPRVTVTRRLQWSTVDIHGEATVVVPFVHLPVHGHATGENERFVPPPG